MRKVNSSTMAFLLASIVGGAVVICCVNDIVLVITTQHALLNSRSKSEWLECLGGTVGAHYAVLISLLVENGVLAAVILCYGLRRLWRHRTPSRSV